ncbi:MAG: MarR family transcriptional regulator [Actinomycetales bacterium]|nr:MAG: MarR family transcriptional regulator [Actinomycetales bacterium]
MSTGSDEAARLYLAVIRLNRALRRDSPEAVVGHGGLSALATLIQDGPQRAGTLAQVEGITAPAMTRTLNSLEALGYVERTTDPADGRAQLVAATHAGEALVLRGRSARLQALQERFERLGEDSRSSLVEALAALEELTSDPDD